MKRTMLLVGLLAAVSFAGEEHAHAESAIPPGWPLYVETPPEHRLDTACNFESKDPKVYCLSRVEREEANYPGQLVFLGVVAEMGGEKNQLWDYKFLIRQFDVGQDVVLDATSLDSQSSTKKGLNITTALACGANLIMAVLPDGSRTGALLYTKVCLPSGS